MDVAAHLESIRNQSAEIRDYFGYEGDWRVLPIEDMTDEFWMLRDDVEITWWDKNPVEDDEAEEYGGEVYHKGVFRKEEFTAVLVDTQCDGNIYFSVFRNENEVKVEDLDYE